MLRTRPNTPTCAALDAMIEQLAQSLPDLGTEQGRLDYRALLLARSGRALIDLPELEPDDAVFLYQLIGDRLRGLLHLGLLTEHEAKDMIAGRVEVYARYRPELLPRILTNKEAD